jgi:hypothetical protein
MKLPFHTFFRRQSVVPFETMFAFYCMYSGIAGLLNFGVTNDIFKTVLGSIIANIFNVGYILAGAGMYFGIGVKRGDIEGFGLIAIATSVLIRMVAVGWVGGFSPTVVNLYAFSIAFLAACAVRFSYIVRGETILTLRDVARGIVK